MNTQKSYFYTLLAQTSDKVLDGQELDNGLMVMLASVNTDDFNRYLMQAVNKVAQGKHEFSSKNVINELIKILPNGVNSIPNIQNCPNKWNAYKAILIDLTFWLSTMPWVKVEKYGTNQVTYINKLVA